MKTHTFFKVLPNINTVVPVRVTCAHARKSQVRLFGTNTEAKEWADRARNAWAK